MTITRLYSPRLLRRYTGVIYYQPVPALPAKPRVGGAEIHRQYASGNPRIPLWFFSRSRSDQISLSLSLSLSLCLIRYYLYSRLYSHLYRILDSVYYSVYFVYIRQIPHPSVISRTTFRGLPSAPRLYLLSGRLQLDSPLDRSNQTYSYTIHSVQHDMDIPMNEQPNHPSTAPESTLNAQPSASADTSMLTSNPAVNPSTTQTYTSDIHTQTQPSAQCQTQAQSQSQFSEQPSDLSTTLAPGPSGPGSDPAAAAEYPHQIHGVGGPTATAPFLQDFSLVAEAAKRAQMAVVMRDMEGISL